MAGSQPPPENDLQRATFGSQDWQALLAASQLGEGLDKPMELEESPLFRLTSDGTLLDELLKTLSGGAEGGDLNLAPLFSEKTLNALMGGQLQQFASEAQKELEADPGAVSAAAAGAAPLDAALALLQQGGGGSSALPTAEDAPGEQPKRYFTLQEAAEAIGLIPKGSGGAAPGGGGGGLQRSAASGSFAAGLQHAAASGSLASFLAGLQGVAAAQQEAAAQPSGQPQQAQLQQPFQQQQQQQPAQAQQAQQGLLALMDGQIVSKDGTVLVGPLPPGQQLRLQVPGPDGSVQYIPVLDSRVISLPAQRSQQQQQQQRSAAAVAYATAATAAAAAAVPSAAGAQASSGAGGGAAAAGPIPQAGYLHAIPPQQAQQGNGGVERKPSFAFPLAAGAAPAMPSWLGAGAAPAAVPAAPPGLPRPSSQPSLSNLPSIALPTAPTASMPRSSSHTSLPGMLPGAAALPATTAALVLPAPAAGAALDPTIAATQQLVAVAAAQQQVLQQTISSRAMTGQLATGLGGVGQPDVLQQPQHAQQPQQAGPSLLLLPQQYYSSVPATSAQQAEQLGQAATLPVPILRPSPAHPLARSCPEPLLSELPPASLEDWAASGHSLPSSEQQQMLGGGAAAGGLALPSKPCHKRERSIRSANPEALGLAPAAKALRNLEGLLGEAGSAGGAGGFLGGGPSAGFALDLFDVNEGASVVAGHHGQQGMSSLIEDTGSAGHTAASSPYAALSGVQDQFLAAALAGGGGGGRRQQPAVTSRQRGAGGTGGTPAASAALLLASPPTGRTPPPASAGGRAFSGGAAAAATAAAAAGTRRSGGGSSRRGRSGAATPRAAAAPARLTSADEEEIQRIIAQALARPPGKRRGRPPGRRSGTLPPEYEAELEEANILRELLQDPDNRALPIEDIKRLMRREKNKKMAAFSRTKNVLHVSQLEEEVRKLSEEREWLATQLEQGPPPDLPAQKVLRGGGAGSKPLKRHVSF